MYDKNSIFTADASTEKNQILNFYNSMTKEKLVYTSPEVDALVIRFEGVICTSQTGSSSFGENGNITDLSGVDWGW